MASDDKDVGYKRPPKSGQFKRGQSGNPRGRPKGAPNFKADLAAEMRERITLRDKNGRARRVTKQRALVKLLFSSALQNEKSAIMALLACMRYFGTGNEELPAESQNADPTDLALLESYLARQRKQIARAEKESKTKTRKHKR